MLIRLSNSTFVRHVTDESVVWCPRTGGCTIMRDVQPFLEEIGWNWRRVNDIKKTIAAKFCCMESDIEDDFRMEIGRAHV